MVEWGRSRRSSACVRTTHASLVHLPICLIILREGLERCSCTFYRGAEKGKVKGKNGNLVPFLRSTFPFRLLSPSLPTSHPLRLGLSNSLYKLLHSWLYTLTPTPSSASFLLTSFRNRSVWSVAATESPITSPHHRPCPPSPALNARSQPLGIPISQ